MRESNNLVPRALFPGLGGGAGKAPWGRGWESKGIGKFSLGGGLEGKLISGRAGGAGRGVPLGPWETLAYTLAYSLLTIPTLTLLLPSCLQSRPQQLFDECFPLKTVRVSPRYPVRLTPLIKLFLKRNPDSKPYTAKHVVQLKQRTSNCTIKSRKALAGGKRCSMGWWRNLDGRTRQI